jgi:hypothetical protein
MIDSQMTPEMIRAILSSPDQDPQALDVARRQKMADMMRQRSVSPVDPIQAGRLVLPNYGGAMSNVAQAYMAKKAQPGIDAQMTEVNNKQAGTRQGYMQALQQALRRPPPQQPPMTMDPSTGAEAY